MTERYKNALKQAESLLRGVSENVPNMANLSALIWQTVERINWAGFYTVTDAGDLLLGPFQGKPACIRIPRGKGVCGTALETGRTLRVPDVHRFPGHIACDEASRSEVVTPVYRSGEIVAVLDVDSPEPDRFGEDEAAFFEALATLLGENA